jgi:GABA(A) receptor-associated protein
MYSMSSYLRRFKTHGFEERRRESDRIMSQYPDKCCVVVGKCDNSDVNDIDRHKFLVPGDLSIGQFMFVIRKRIRLAPEKSIFVFVDNLLPPMSALVRQIYSDYKDKDGFLYLCYATESTFG